MITGILVGSWKTVTVLDDATIAAGARVADWPCSVTIPRSPLAALTAGGERTPSVRPVRAGQLGDGL
jgi:hypothetical protein